MSRNKHSQRRGAAAVEFAVIAPMMIMLTFGLVEVGRIMLVKQTAVHASREGARIAVRPTADDNDVVQRVTEELNIMALSDAVIETEPASLADAAPGSTVTVRVRINLTDISWIPGVFDFAASEIIAETAMRRESTQ